MLATASSLTTTVVDIGSDRWPPQYPQPRPYRTGKVSYAVLYPWTTYYGNLPSPFSSGFELQPPWRPQFCTYEPHHDHHPRGRKMRYTFWRLKKNRDVRKPFSQPAPHGGLANKFILINRLKQHPWHTSEICLNLLASLCSDFYLRDQSKSIH